MNCSHKKGRFILILKWTRKTGDRPKAFRIGQQKGYCEACENDCPSSSQIRRVGSTRAVLCRLYGDRLSNKTFFIKH